MGILPKPDAIQERNYHKRLILSKRDFYLKTNIVNKILEDAPYREKVELIAGAFHGHRGWILDVGAHTCGEAEYLALRGLKVVAVDVNEYALGLSKERVAKYGNPGLSYVACDAHHLPFADASLSGAVMNESLHHMEHPLQTLRETFRVLRPGSQVFLYEPYAFNPYRRLSEIRDRFKGTIEKSFGVHQMKDLLVKSGFRDVLVRRHVLPPSSSKMALVGPVSRALKSTYFQTSKAMPWMFGNLLVTAIKPGRADGAECLDLDASLRCPITSTPVERKGPNFVTRDGRIVYPCHSGIPILIREDAVRSDS